MTAAGYRGKRTFDLVLAGTGLVLLAPLMLALALLVRTSTPGPVVYRARRVGALGSDFEVFKFRSMRTGASGAPITAADDDRITSVGRWLRRMKLDELPQLVNVVRGEMSIVGPRPEDPRYVARYSAEQRRLLEWRPGITSPASVAHRREEELLAGSDDRCASYISIMNEKLAIDLAYFPNSSLRSDVRILVDTVAAVFGRAR